MTPDPSENRVRGWWCTSTKCNTVWSIVVAAAATTWSRLRLHRFSPGNRHTTPPINLVHTWCPLTCGGFEIRSCNLESVPGMRRRLPLPGLQIWMLMRRDPRGRAGVELRRVMGAAAAGAARLGAVTAAGSVPGRRGRTGGEGSRRVAGLRVAQPRRSAAPLASTHTNAASAGLKTNFPPTGLR